MWGLRLVPDPEYGMEQKNENMHSRPDATRYKRTVHQCSEHTIEAQRTLSTLISNIPGMIYRCYDDDEETMEYVSDGCLGLTGYRPSDFMDHMVKYNDLIHRDDRERVASGLQEALRYDRQFSFTYRILDVNSREKWVWEQGICSRLKTDRLIVRDGFITDITARVNAERKLEEAWKQADMYVDTMGHDVNNMNQIALGYLELALEKLEQNGRLDVADRVLLEKPFEAVKSNSRLVDKVRKMRRKR